MKVVVRVQVALVVAFSGFDRIDLLHGQSSFRLTPALLLAPVSLVMLVTISSRSSRSSTGSGVSRWTTIGVWLSAAYLLLAGLSIIGESTGDSSSGRLALLAILIVNAWSAVGLVAALEDAAALRRGAWLGLWLSIVSDIVQIMAWVERGPAQSAWIGPVDIMAPTYGLYAPRPAGISIDPNRGALCVVFFLYIILCDKWVASSQKRALFTLPVGLSGIVVLATFSRSGILLWAIVLAAALRSLRRSMRWRKAGALLAILLVAFLSVRTGRVSVAGSGYDLRRLVTERGDFGASSSGGVHFELYRRAGAAVGESWEALILGIGFGNSPSALREVYGDNSYANFHSFFLTSFVELGALGLILAIGILVAPGFGSRPLLALLLVGFSIFYQAHLDGLFWLSLAWAWSRVGARDVGSLDSSGQSDSPAQMSGVSRQGFRLIAADRNAVANGRIEASGGSVAGRASLEEWQQPSSKVQDPVGGV